ncbi:MAG TPA: hypothetical protein DCO70_00015 [Verrucomicrobiales bacterium]|nr:hypothetical protein [Verrucomicrobiales bacterium]|tara:strand:+ start:2216 stop:2743 length:528 start_codon:yes stop_codon:yes gene_type:complete
MQLDETQKKTVAGWVEEGLDLSAIQSRLESEMDIRMTYMDVRFLVGDLELTPKDEEEPEPSEPPEPPQDAPAAMAADAPTPENPFPDPEDPMDEMPPEADSNNASGDVSVTVSPVTKPGTMASGSVTFSDGVTCDWHVDQLGRPALVPPSDGYRPPEADMPKFGQKLQQELRGGF